MARVSEILSLFLFQGFFQIYSNEISSSIISVFENQQACLVVNEIANMQTITLYKNESLVLSWRKDQVTLGKGYKNNKLNILKTGNKLEFCINNISRADASKYTWKDNKGKTHSTLLLNVWYGPTEVLFTPNMSASETLNERSTLSINCSAVCNPYCNFNWVKNKDIRISNSSIFMLGSVSKMDRGNYTCIVTNVKSNNQSISTGFEINVNYAADINMPVSGYIPVPEYSSINITCNVSSFPISNISWHSENKEINTIFRGQNKAVLNLSNNTCDDSGNYTCSAFNGIGIKDTKNVTLEVFCKPRFVGTYAGHKIKKRVSASIGDEMNINVKVKAHPRPKLLFNSSIIDINFTTVSDHKYDVIMRKTILSEFDFQETLIIIGNSQGNVTIAIEVENRKRQFAVAYNLIVGGVVSILTLLSISFLVFTVLRRTSHQKVNQAVSSNSPNNVDTGGYRDNILYQSVDSVSFRDQIFDFDNAAANFDVEDSSVSSINQVTNRCFEKDGIQNQKTKSCTEKTNHKGEEDHFNVNLDKNIKTKNTCDTIKGRKPMPRPRTSKTHHEFSKQVPKSYMQKTSNFGNRTIPDIISKCDVFEPELNRTQSVDSDYSLKKSKYALHGTQQCFTEAAFKKPGKKSNNLKVEDGQVPEQHELCMDRNEPTKDYKEVWDEQEKCSQYTKQLDFASEQACESHSISNDDDPCQFQDYMNI